MRPRQYVLPVEFSYSSDTPDILILPSMAGNLPVINASAQFVGLSPYSNSSINISEPANCSIFLANPYYLENPSYIGVEPPCVFDITAGLRK
jgi:hypothetical protein